MWFSHLTGGFSFGAVTGIIIVTVIVIVFFTVYNAVYSVLRILVNRQIYEKFTTPGMAVAHAFWEYYFRCMNPFVCL